jgi:HAD superfamily hydrolase (TIGR01662 family)
MMRQVQNVLATKKVFIFDLDGTLIESRQNQLQGIWSIVKNLTPDKTMNYQTILEEFDKVEKIDKQKRYEVYISLGLAASKEECKDIDFFYWEGVGSVFKWMDGAEEVLAALKRNGKKLSIVTNGGEVQHKKLNLIRETIESSIIDFDMTLVTGDYGIEKYKPDPYCLNKVIEHYEAAGQASRYQCVYVGNSIEKDCEMAKNAGVDFVLFDPAEINYDFSGDRITDLGELLCTTSNF